MNPFFLKDRAILHNTRDGSEFYVPYLSQATCNFRERTWALGRVGGRREGIPGLHTCLLQSLLKNITRFFFSNNHLTVRFFNFCKIQDCKNIP